jgi:hypothetical protein
MTELDQKFFAVRDYLREITVWPRDAETDDVLADCARSSYLPDLSLDAWKTKALTLLRAWEAMGRG